MDYNQGMKGMAKMLNNKKKIAELEKEIEFKTQTAETRQEQLLKVRLENEGLRAEVAALKSDNESLSKDIKENSLNVIINELEVDPLTWICGEPKKLGWYFVAHPNGTTILYYNPASSRSKWMRGEKGNAERFEGKVIAYMEAPEYES